MRKIPVLISIDVEPDERAIDPRVPKDWEGFEKTFELFRKLRPRLEAATSSSVHFSWFLRMDPQIALTYGSPDWAVKRYRSQIEEMERAGDEIGIHVHAWRPGAPPHQWTLDYENQEWVEHCVRTSFDAFRQSLNRPCLSFRFGDHWINNASLDLVEKLGARCDLTTEPGQKEFFSPDGFTLPTPDYTRVPRLPYRPSADDFTRRGVWRKRKLWILPSSTGATDWELDSLIRGQDRISPNGNSHHTDPVYEGFLDRADARMIAGWAYDATRPDHPLNVEVYDGENLLATIPADNLRRDLLSAGKGNGRHCFSLPVPSRLRDGIPHWIRAKVAGSDFELSHSPKELKTSAADWVEEGVLLLNTNPWLMRRGIEALLWSLRKPYLSFPVRSEVTLHLYELANLEENINYLLSHPWAKKFVFETPAQLLGRLE